MTIKNLYPTVRPSLDLNFAATKRLDPRITYSRASTGTYFGADGLLKSAAVNEARFDHNPNTGESLGLLVEEARTNVLQRSGDLANSIWQKTNTSLIPNAALAPDGTFTASKLAEDTSNGFHTWNYTKYTIGFVDGRFSIYAKAEGRTRIALQLPNGNIDNSSEFTAFDLSNGTVISGSGRITAAGNGWYRCEVSYGGTITQGETTPNVKLYNDSSQLSYQGNGSSGVYLWGPQLEVNATFPTSYIPTPATFTSRASSATYYDANGVIQTASTNVARSAAFFPDSNGVMRPAGLLLEAAGTNLLTYSEQFDNAAWSKTNATITADALAAPTGSVIADLLLETSSTGAHAVTQSITTAASRYTVSFFVRNNGRDRLAIGGSTSLGGNLGVGIVFDLSTNSYISGASSGSSASVQLLPNSWRRISYSWDANATTGVIGIYLIDSGTNTSYTGDTSKGIYIWGAQLEASPYPTSYIATTTSTATRAADTSTSATVTRSADVAQITGTNFSSWYNQSQGTIQVRLANINQSTANSIWSLDDTTSSQRIMFRVGAGAQVSNFSTISDTASPYTATHAFAISANSLSGAKNGVLYPAPTGTGIPTVTQLQFGVGPAVNRASGHISRFTYWPTRLSDATLQAITR